MPTQPAVLGSARLGNFRLGYNPTALADVRATRVTIFLAGVLANSRVRRDGFTIHDALNEAPNTCNLVVDGTAPVTGQDLRVTVNSDAPVLLFNGTLQTVTQSYEGKPTQLAWACTAVDDTARANRKRPFGTWTNISATTIAQYLVTTFAPGFTATHVEAALPLVSITFDGSQTFSGCLASLAQLIGGYFYWEDLDLHFFLTEATDQPLDLDSTPGRFLDEPPIKAESDDSQLRTRVYGKGHGEALLSDVAAGETILPIADAVMFNVLGGQAIAGTIPDGAQSQILTYAGVELGGAGSLVGPGVAPSVAPSAVAVPGSGVDAGVHQAAYTWVTAAGETMPSPLATVTTGSLQTPTGQIVAADYADGTSYGSANLAIGDVLTFKLRFVRELGVGSQSNSGPVSASYTIKASPLNPALMENFSIAFPGTEGDPLAIGQALQVSRNGGAYYHAGSFAGTGAVTKFGFFNNFSTAGSAVTPAPDVKAINYTGVAIGPSGVTSRKIYRTAAAGAQLKLQQTIANNTATVGVQDTTADASLGANAPTGDTSGLVTAVGQINAGSTTLLTSGWPFATSGRVTIGQQVVQYTGVSGNTLTGIPASGDGSIVSTIKYGEHVDVAPALLGVTGNALAMQKGTPVKIWVQRNDLAAQAALIALDAAQGRVSDGVVEGQPIVDERRGEASLIARCDADLALFSRPLVTVTYATRDTKTKSGKPIVINLTSPLISETLTIQDVTIDQIDIAPGLAPRFSVTASSVRFSLEDVLRQLITKAAA